MQTTDLILNRRSQPRLKAPAPNNEQLTQMLQAAVSVPDHAALKPWHFTICQGSGLKKLGDVFEQAAIANDLSERDIERAPQMPLRAPMVIVVACRYTEHEKVPLVEQISAASCSVYAMQLVAKELGFDSIWRTGPYAHFDEVKQALSLSEDDQIVGYLYLGTAQKELPERTAGDIESCVAFWS